MGCGASAATKAQMTKEFMLDLPGNVKLSCAEMAGSIAELPPLILVHGYLDSWRSWSRVLPRLSVGGRRVLAITLRGWGDSDKCGAYTIDAYAADIIAVLDAFSIPKAVLGGHSMGTIISTAVAARQPDRVAQLVLCGASPKMDPAYICDPDGTTFQDIGDLTAGFKDTNSVDKDFLESFQLGDLKPFMQSKKVDAAFGEQVMRETVKADVRAYGEAWNGMLVNDHTAELCNVKATALLVWGTQDGVFPEQQQQALMEQLGGGASLVKVEGAPHGVIWTHAEEVAVHMNTFLCK